MFSQNRSSFCASAVFLGFISCHLQCLHAWYNPAFIPLYVIVSFSLAGVRWRLCICILEWMARLSYRDLISLKRGSRWLLFSALQLGRKFCWAFLLIERERESQEGLGGEMKSSLWTNVEADHSVTTVHSQHTHWHTNKQALGRNISLGFIFSIWYEILHKLRE